MNKRKTFLNKVGTKTLYLVTLFALAAVAAAGFLLVPTNNTVSAQDNVISATEQVSHEVLTSALNFRTATEFAVLGEKGISDNGGSKISGDVGVGVGKGAHEVLHVAGLTKLTDQPPEMLPTSVPTSSRT